jgi:hypothetical protein
MGLRGASAAPPRRLRGSRLYASSNRFVAADVLVTGVSTLSRVATLLRDDGTSYTDIFKREAALGAGLRVFGDDPGRRPFLSAARKQAVFTAPARVKSGV